ncbi:lambda repressor-like predicted transcriptional regulator [Rhizobium skierniewicense]|uniref:Lambda repressor-like predicted transcriptional regulator n=1 Tax=Rhizobium skierniewicense TaxID=984260 RepID=A0A7W6G2X4_9HYPH|nr:helix-turn-helix domain-containing protein [Rhizobium skierniewicense]MBB3947255.1 lambda repressor-like predicted transcriptional regulator [Rhizobium skierniewicense]
MTTTKTWTRAAIKDELLRQNKTLTGIARDAGLYDSACRAGVIGASRPGAEAVAKALGVPFREMFPDIYTLGRHNRPDTSSNKSCNTSAKKSSKTDGTQNAA